MMAAKNYRAFAALLAAERHDALLTDDGTAAARLAVLNNVTANIADLFEKDNPYFDRARFLTAAREGVNQ